MLACTRDLKEDGLIASDQGGGDDWVISEDKDILILGVVGHVGTMTPCDFVRRIPHRSGA